MILRYDQGMTTRHETPDHPLTETAAAELSKKFMPGVAFQILASVSPDDLTEYARAAFDAGQKYQDDLEDDTIRNIMKDVHHLRVERDTADNAVADLTAKVERVEALAETWEEAARLVEARGGDAETVRDILQDVRTALNGDDQ